MGLEPQSPPPLDHLAEVEPWKMGGICWWERIQEKGNEVGVN